MTQENDIKPCPDSETCLLLSINGKKQWVPVRFMENAVKESTTNLPELPEGKTWNIILMPG